MVERRDSLTTREFQTIMHEGAETLDEVKQVLEEATQRASGTEYEDDVTWDNLGPVRRIKAVLHIGGGDELGEGRSEAEEERAMRRVNRILEAAKKEDPEVLHELVKVRLEGIFGEGFFDDYYERQQPRAGYGTPLPPDPLEEIRRDQLRDKEWSDGEGPIQTRSTGEFTVDWRWRPPGPSHGP